MAEELVASDIRVAKTLPSKFYYGEEIFKSLKSTFNGWQFAVHDSEMNENSIIPLDHIEPTIIVRGEKTQCLSNICTHRGMRLASQPCTKSILQCEYHGRTFDLNGKMKHMPEFEQAIDFPSESDNLRNFSMHRWNGLHFVSQDSEQHLPWAEIGNRFEFLNI